MARRQVIRLLVLAAGGLLLFAAAAFYWHFWYSLPVGAGPAGPAVARQAFAKPWTTRKVLLLGVGDSVTAGFGVAPQYAYFGRLKDNSRDEFPEMQGLCLSTVLPNLNAQNIAVSGSTSLTHLDLLREKLAPQTNDVFGLVVMTTGGNDLIHDYGRSPPREGAMYGATLAQAQPWIADFATRLQQMIALLESRFPGGCMIFIADIYDPTDGLGDATRVGLPPWPDGVAIHREYNDTIRRCAQQHASVHLVPMHAGFLGHGIHCTQFWRAFYRTADPHYWYAWNLEDPNTRGYDAIRRLFLIEIAKQAEHIAGR